MKTWIRNIAVILLACGAMVAQQQPGIVSFEVASIKPSAPQPMGMMRIMMNADAGMLHYSNVALKDVIRAAYRVQDFQIEGPDWLGSTRFDIEAKYPAGATQDQVPEMLQSLLAERFKLAVHRDSKERPIYALVPGKNGAQLKPAEIQTRDAAAAPAPPPAGGDATAGNRDVARGTRPGGPPRNGMMIMMDPAGMHLKANSTTLANLAEALSKFAERPVVDTTGIKGEYDFDLVFSPETMRNMPRGVGGPMPPPGGERAAGSEAQPEPRASIFDAVQRYGLKLEPRKAPLDVITIDHIEKTPTEN